MRLPPRRHPSARMGMCSPPPPCLPTKQDNHVRIAATKNPVFSRSRRNWHAILVQYARAGDDKAAHTCYASRHRFRRNVWSYSCLGFRLGIRLPPNHTAAAPPTISDNSCVIAACRALLYTSCKSSIKLPALSVAAFIATILAACSQAEFSATA